MPNYNKNSVFAVSSAGTIPNRVDDLIFFEDIDKDQLSIWNEFERIMSTGDYNAAQTFIKGYADVHGYFGDLYNLMVNRIKAVQNFLVLNETNIRNATGAFSSFKKPEIFVYQEEPDTPKNIVKDQVWIGPKGYFDEVAVKESINKLKPVLGNDNNLKDYTFGGFHVQIDDDGYVIINGTNPSGRTAIRLGYTPNADEITSADVWSYWNYYVSGKVENANSGNFEFLLYASPMKSITMPTTRTANMHANLIGIQNKTEVELFFNAGVGEVYTDLKVGFMICKTAETTPNQKFVKYEGS